jgi:hypothetical protein
MRGLPHTIVERFVDMAVNPQGRLIGFDQLGHVGGVGGGQPIIAIRRIHRIPVHRMVGVNRPL